MTKQRLDQKHALDWRAFATLALIIAAVYILGSHRHAVAASLDAARHADVPWVLLALALMSLTFVVASLIYGVLTLHSLRLRQTLLIQLAASFVGRLLPAGLGGLGLNGVYLYRRRHTPAEATAVVSVNNLIGMAAHLLLLAGLVALRPDAVSSLLHRRNASVPWAAMVAAMVLLIAVMLMPPFRRQLVRFVRNLVISVKKEKPYSLVSALLLAGLLTATYTALLCAAARAVGVQLGIAQIFVVFSFGMLAGTVTPTPGGLVGAEAGLYAGFTAYGVAADQAGAAVLVCRLITYWLPLLPGVFALYKARTLRLL